MQLVRAADPLIADVEKLNAALERRAREFKRTPTIGRSHGIHAEPTTFGLKLAYAHAEFDRAKARLKAARAEVATCAIWARSAPSRKSIRAWRRTWRRRWGYRLSRSPRR